MRMGDMALRCSEGRWQIVRDCLGQSKGVYVLAWWTIDKEGASLEFIGGRPFDNGVKRKAFWRLAKYGQKQADKQMENTASSR